MPDFAFLDDAPRFWAGKTPYAPAVRFDRHSYSYAQLDQAATAVAGHLTHLGVQAGDRVALYAEKSFETIAAVLGILKTGAAYVPIDPGAPELRVQAVCDDCDVAVVLACKATARRYAARPPLVLLSQAVTSTHDFAPRTRTPQDLAYILYSSGSTGTPKGICHSHTSGLAYATMAADLCALTPQDRVSHLTPLHFDMSIFDLFSTFCAGACTVVIPRVYTKIPASLSTLAQDEALTVWYSVPFALAQLGSRGALDARDLSALRIVMFAGEVMPPHVLRDIAPFVPNARFLNAYGPTETNHCTTAEIDRASLDHAKALPIGSVAPGMNAQVSTTGELWISGPQVMQGYWKNKDLTDAAFVTADDADPSQRVYRTGDLVTQSPDGTLYLMGRADRQVKLRGHRIELDEVELVLTACPDVTEAAVLLIEDNLHAFTAGPATAQNVTDYATAHLPAYAVPARITVLAALPRTSTGKIDRTALIGPKDARTAA